MLTAAPDATSKPRAIGRRPCWRLPALTPTSRSAALAPGRSSTLQAHPVSAPTWQSDPSSSPTSPTRSKTKSAKATPSRSGRLREAAEHPPSFGEIACGAPPTASIPKTQDQPEEKAASKLSRPWKQRLDRVLGVPLPASRCEGRPATGSTRRTSTATTATPYRGPTASEQAAPAPPIARLSLRVACSEHQFARRAAMEGQAAHCRIWLFLSDQGPGSAPAGRRVSRCAAGRASLRPPFMV